ncbi:MAG: hypothetical protein RSE46_13095, partial [Janthinobacterium sp.]
PGARAKCRASSGLYSKNLKAAELNGINHINSLYGINNINRINDLYRINEINSINRFGGMPGRTMKFASLYN